MQQDFESLVLFLNSYSNELIFYSIVCYVSLQNMQDGAAVAGLAIAGASLVAVNVTGNAIYDPIGSILVGNLLGMVRGFRIQQIFPAI